MDRSDGEKGAISMEGKASSGENGNLLWRTEEIPQQALLITFAFLALDFVSASFPLHCAMISLCRGVSEIQAPNPGTSAHVHSWAHVWNKLLLVFLRECRGRLVLGLTPGNGCMINIYRTDWAGSIYSILERFKQKNAHECWDKPFEIVRNMHRGSF